MYYKDRLKELRKERNLKQADLADLLKLTPKSYSSYEIEHDILPIKHLNVLINFFDVSFDYILGFSNMRNYPMSKKIITEKEIGTRLKLFRKENNITQVNIAKELNTTHSVISGYENGRYYISTTYLYYICKTYNVSADYLLAKTDTPKYLRK